VTLGRVSSWVWQQVDAVQARLQTWPAVNFGSISLIVLDFLTLGWAWRLSYQTGANGDSGVLDAWLTFLAARHGINFGAYWRKRGTSFDRNADEDTPPSTQPQREGDPSGH